MNNLKLLIYWRINIKKTAEELNVISFLIIMHNVTHPLRMATDYRNDGNVKVDVSFYGRLGNMFGSASVFLTLHCT